MNFIQRPLPANSTTGALSAGADFDNDVPGALGMGQRASTGLTLCKFVDNRGSTSCQNGNLQTPKDKDKDKADHGICAP